MLYVPIVISVHLCGGACKRAKCVFAAVSVASRAHILPYIGATPSHYLPGTIVPRRLTHCDYAMPSVFISRPRFHPAFSSLLPGFSSFFFFFDFFRFFFSLVSRRSADLLKFRDSIESLEGLPSAFRFSYQSFFTI